MINIDPNTRLIDLTVGELLDLIASASHPKETIMPQMPERKKVYGIAGIAQIFNCSTRTANRIKQSGKIDRAITQIGRTFVVDVEMALNLNN